MKFPMKVVLKFHREQEHGAKAKGEEYLSLSPLFPSKREKNIQTVCIFFEGSVLTFQFLNDENTKWIFLT